MTEPSRESLRGRAAAVLRTNKCAIAAELLLGPGLIVLKIAGVIRNPQLLRVLIGWLSLWVRREGWRGVGLRLPSNWARVVVLGTLIGLAYNALDIFVVLPLIHRLTGTPIIAHGVEDTSSLILLFAGFQPPG